jgi:hypothetical protein
MSSGDVDIKLGRQRLSLAHPLEPLEPLDPAQDPIDLTAEVCLVAQQAIRRVLTWNDRGRQFVLPSLPVISLQYFLQLGEMFDFSVDQLGEVVELPTLTTCRANY